jgi:photosystem II stability/assembly factor-like uncharacterized protein
MRPVLLAAPPPAPPAGHPAAIAFWNVRRGLYAHESRVSLTTDGGRTFHVVLRTSRPVAGMQAFGKRGAIVDVAGGTALRTLDAGSTWRPFRHDFDADFATPRIGLGFRVGRFEFVRGFYATRDGGASWHARRSPCPRRFAFSAAVELVTPRLGWATCVGQPGAGQQPKAVFSTADGGRTWRRRGDLSWSGYVWGSAFARDGFGLVWESRGTLYVTRDGGDHWNGRTDVAIPEIDFGGGGAAFAGGRGLVFLSRGDRPARLLATRDFGRTWRVVHRW